MTEVSIMAGFRGDLLDRMLIELPYLPAVPAVVPRRLGTCELSICKRRARAAKIIEFIPVLPAPVWMKVCGRHNRQLSRLTGRDWPGDEAAFARYRELQALRCIP